MSTSDSEKVPPTVYPTYRDLVLAPLGTRVWDSAGDEATVIRKGDLIYELPNEDGTETTPVWIPNILTHPFAPFRTTPPPVTAKEAANRGE